MRLCGIDTALLALKPTPDELAAIVARMDPGQVALFIALWSEQINAHHGPRAAAHILGIAESIVLEDDSSGAVPGDGYATALIHDLARDLAQRLPR
jgi:hypothetical protein